MTNFVQNGFRNVDKLINSTNLVQHVFGVLPNWQNSINLVDNLAQLTDFTQLFVSKLTNSINWVWYELAMFAKLSNSTNLVQNVAKQSSTNLDQNFAQLTNLTMFPNWQIFLALLSNCLSYTVTFAPSGTSYKYSVSPYHKGLFGKVGCFNTRLLA